MLENNHTPPTLIEDLGYKIVSSKTKQRAKKGLFLCQCGHTFEAVISKVNTKHTKSCGCLKEKPTNVKHNLRNNRLYFIWYNMVQRCSNDARTEYKHYGAKGIKVCDRWLNIVNFIEDMHPTFKEGLSLDRINSNGNYEPSNCRWATKTEQVNNRELKNNCNGFIGVTYHSDHGRVKRYSAKIMVANKSISLGYYNEAKEAGMAYNKFINDNNLDKPKNNIK